MVAARVDLVAPPVAVAATAVQVGAMLARVTGGRASIVDVVIEPIGRHAPAAREDPAEW